MELWVFSSCAAILAVLLIRFCFGDRMKAGLRYALWLIVLVVFCRKTMITFPVQSSWSCWGKCRRTLRT